jgi:phosphatidylglycerophosphatase A
VGREISEEEEIDSIKKIIATGFFLGYIPVAPATFSCVISICIWYFLVAYKGIYIALAIVLFAVGVVLSRDLARKWGEDPRQIVIDEYACFLLPLYFTPKRWLPLIITFLLFRFFDIVKPPPLKHLERVPHGWGIMLDDLGAAVYTTIVSVIVLTVFGI